MTAIHIITITERQNVLLAQSLTAIRAAICKDRDAFSEVMAHLEDSDHELIDLIESLNTQTAGAPE